MPGGYLITGFGTAPMLHLPGLEAFTGCCRCKAAGTQMYSLCFKCPPTQEIRYPVKAYPRGTRGPRRPEQVCLIFPERTRRQSRCFHESCPPLPFFLPFHHDDAAEDTTSAALLRFPRHGSAHPTILVISRKSRALHLPAAGRSDPAEKTRSAALLQFSSHCGVR